MDGHSVGIMDKYMIILGLRGDHIEWPLIPPRPPTP